MSDWKKLAVMLLNTQMEPAGAQKAMLTLARGLKVCASDVIVVTMYDKGDYIPVFQERYGLEIINLAMKRSGEHNPARVIVRLLRGVWRLYHLMRNVHVVQTFSHYSNILGPFLACLARVPVRVSSQRMSLRGYPAWLLWLDKTVANSGLVDKMVAVSEGTRRFCIREHGIKANKVVTIRNGIDVGRFASDGLLAGRQNLRRELGFADADLVVTTVARLHAQKGHRFLIEAIPPVLDVFPRARFMFVGEGALRAELETMVFDIGVDDVVRFLGVRRDVPELLVASDLFVLPSLWEGLPNAVLEAMAAGVPVIATDVDGCPEIVIDGRTGLLIPPANSVALRQAICTLLGNESLRNSMAKAAKAKIEKEFSQQANLQAFVDLYHHLVAKSVFVGSLRNSRPCS